MFIQKRNDEYYSEAYHIIPVNEISKTKLSIDNLISVCANHHRQIHYGDVELITNNEFYIE
ncbi:HNH endonuclease [Paraclostridium sordellii]|uniref:HNH endonuclease n=1 Tax=Paraclostridium sordellii TaxID=1505 RepID=UPI0018CD048C